MNAHGAFFRGVHEGSLHGRTITVAPITLPPVVSEDAYFHGFRAGLRLAWRWRGYRVPNHDRYVSVAWRRYERKYGR